MKIRLDIIYLLINNGKGLLIMARDNLLRWPKVKALVKVNTEEIIKFF
jgi:hypothetical protein